MNIFDRRHLLTTAVGAGAAVAAGVHGVGWPREFRRSKDIERARRISSWA
jgi:hypothetical protein